MNTFGKEGKDTGDAAYPDVVIHQLSELTPDSSCVGDDDGWAAAKIYRGVFHS